MVNNVNTPFSPQELKVAELLACGLSEKEIAEEFVSPRLLSITIQGTSAKRTD